MLSRRNALTMLGLAASGSALAAEDFVHEENRFVNGANKSLKQLPIVVTSGKQMADALRKLAEEIGSGGVIIEGINVSTELRSQEMIRQKLSFDLLIADPKTA